MNIDRQETQYWNVQRERKAKQQICINLRNVLIMLKHIGANVFYYHHSMREHVQMMDDFDTLIKEDILMWHDFPVLHELVHNRTFDINI
jgi:hypothetical protein